MQSILFYLKNVTLIALIHIVNVNAFTIIPSVQKIQSSRSLRTTSTTNDNLLAIEKCTTTTSLTMSPAHSQDSLQKLPEDDDTPITFLDVDGSSFIECYADSVAVVNGVEYTIGSPCDNAVSLCYFDEDEQLIPIELDEPLMDDIFNIAARIVEDEFGEELSLQRTPQTLTLIGELEEGESDEEDEEDDDYADDDEEDVEVLLAFEHEDTEYCLVRLLDPVLLVGKAISVDDQRVKLLTTEESDEVMPILEEMFLKAQEEEEEEDEEDGFE